MTDKITQFPVRAKEHDKPIVVAAPYVGCQHKRAIVDPKLADLTCADCGAKLNPIEYIVGLANDFRLFEWKVAQAADARKQLEERSRCRCEKCGEWTKIRRVGKREVARIKRDAAGAGSRDE